VVEHDDVLDQQLPDVPFDVGAVFEDSHCQVEEKFSPEVVGAFMIHSLCLFL